MANISNSYWPLTEEIGLLNTTCGGVLREAVAAVSAEHIALIDVRGCSLGYRRWTYHKLLEESECVARALLARFDPGSHVVIWAPNSAEWVILQLALSLSGMIMVTVNPALTAGELGYVLRQSRAQAVFYQQNYRRVSMADVIAEARHREQLHVEAAICLDDLGDFARDAEPTLSLPTIDPADPAMIQYTSGTTGRPKGAVLSHHSVTNNARIMALLKELGEETINLAVAPLFHTGGCVGGVLGSIQTRGTIVLPEAFDADLMLNLIEQERVTYTFAVPTMLVSLLAAQRRNARDLSSLTTIFSGGDVVPVEIVRRVEAEFGVRLIIGYGLTETSPAITHTRLNDSPRDKSQTVGRAIPQVEIKIIDPRTGNTQPVGEPGELCARGFLTMKEYYHMPEETAETLDAKGWLHTGDLCIMDARGYCRVVGRLKDMIVRGGENIYPREVEEILYNHPAVSEVAVIGIPDEYWGEQVAAVISVKCGATVTGSELRAFLEESLARYKVPRIWYLIDQIPKTSSGKIQKYRLIEMLSAGKLADAEI